jgi:hypothetical protein
MDSYILINNSIFNTFYANTTIFKLQNNVFTMTNTII